MSDDQQAHHKDETKTDLSPLALKSLERYLSEHLTGFNALYSLERFSGGQSNPTYKLMCNLGALVLRRRPFGELLKYH